MPPRRPRAALRVAPSDFMCYDRYGSFAVGRCPTSICCSAGHIFGGALRASSFIPRSRNADPLGCARIPRHSESLRSQVRRLPSVLARTSSRPLSIADEGKGSGRASGRIRPSARVVGPA